MSNDNFFGKPAQFDSPVIDVDATIGKQIVHTKITTNDTDAALDVVTKQFDSAEDSATVNHSAENDSEPANGINRDDTADNLAAVFRLILEFNDADKLRRIRELADARIAALDAQKITPTKADA